MKLAKAVAAMIGVGLAVASPAVAQTRCKQTNVGRMFGAIANKFGSRLVNNQFGNSLSNIIACGLSQIEQKRAEETQQAALNSGKTGASSKRSWASEEHKGVGGGTEVVSRSTTGSQQCAIQRTFVTDVNGEQKAVERNMCQQPNGQWLAA